MKIPKQEKFSQTRAKTLSQEELFYGTQQNNLLMDYISQIKLFQATEDLAFARDKQGHILILSTGETLRRRARLFGSSERSSGGFSSNIIECRMLGIDETTHEIRFRPVSELVYTVAKIKNGRIAVDVREHGSNVGLPMTKSKEENPLKKSRSVSYFGANGIKVSRLRVLNEFAGMGIGRIMLQTIENMGARANLPIVFLESMKSYTPYKGYVPQNMHEMSAMKDLSSGRLKEDFCKFFLDSHNKGFFYNALFDKNLLFYSSQGYVVCPRGIETFYTNDMVHGGVEYVDPTFGIENETEYSPSDFKFNEKWSEISVDKLFDVTFQDKRVLTFDNAYSTTFSPLTIPLNEEGTRLLNCLLTNLRTYTYDVIPYENRWCMTSRTSKPEEPSYSHYSEGEDFKKFVENLDEKEDG